ncbi:UPF0481 protein At3g47200-like [Neltuma alba]|uniref:UPF0481 protein At3g47200-like n=1 Tax=Neltuma alba TaxID=207710 RepID=UPI0010A3CF07|nr:UPF0481 protein At3g47200-like [Prosopis alba]
MAELVVAFEVLFNSGAMKAAIEHLGSSGRRPNHRNKAKKPRLINELKQHLHKSPPPDPAAVRGVLPLVIPIFKFALVQYPGRAHRVLSKMASIKIDMWVSEPSQERVEKSTAVIHPMMEAEVINYVKAMKQDSNEDEIRSSSRKCCIYRVPHTMRDPNNEDAYYYTSKVVSIGPFHYDNGKLKGMERHKQMFFNRLLVKTETGLDDLVRFVMRCEPLVRASYSDEIKLNKKEFVRLILLDAAFIIELFTIVYAITVKKARNDDIRKELELLEHWWLEAAIKDLILLENQVPFFVIERLYKEAFPSGLSEKNSNNKTPSFREITFTFFRSYKKVSHGTEFGEIKHFTDLRRSFFLSGTRTSGHIGEPEFIEDPRDLLLYSATELQEAGVTLKASAKKGKSLLDLNFSSPPYFEIPEIFLEDRTEIFFVIW